MRFKTTLNPNRNPALCKDLSPLVRVLCDVLDDISIEQGTTTPTYTDDEVMCRILAKGYDPCTGKPLNIDKDELAHRLLAHGYDPTTGKPISGPSV
jgi:hypothetical protein